MEFRALKRATACFNSDWNDPKITNTRHNRYNEFKKAELSCDSGFYERRLDIIWSSNSSWGPPPPFFLSAQRAAARSFPLSLSCPLLLRPLLTPHRRNTSCLRCAGRRRRRRRRGGLLDGRGRRGGLTFWMKTATRRRKKLIQGCGGFFVSAAPPPHPHLARRLGKILFFALRGNEVKDRRRRRRQRSYSA